jgi:hypothetical protein
MTQPTRRSLSPAVPALFLTLLPFLTASGLFALAKGIRLGGLLLLFVEVTGPLMFGLMIIGSAVTFFAATKTERLTDWRLLLSVLFLGGAFINFLLFHAHL